MIKNPISTHRLFHIVLLYFILSGPLNLLLASPTGNSSNETSRIKQWQNDLAKDTIPENAVKLKHLYSIPNDDDSKDAAGSSEFVFLRYAENLCYDSSGNILVSDSRNHTIYHFGSDGKLLKTTGRKGKGPGDLLSPKHVFVDPNKQLVVHDSSNGRVQLFGPEGNYSSSFRLFETYNAMAVNNHRQIYCCPFGFNKPLIRIFDYTGKVKGSFGERLTFKQKIFGLNKVFLSMNSKGVLYVAWELFPLVRRYSPEGKLLSEFKLTLPKLLKNERFNRRSINGPPQGRQFKMVIGGIRAKEDGFFIYYYYPRIVIAEYDNSGALKNFFWAEQPYDFIGNDFLVKTGKDNQLMVYVLQVYPVSEITVFSAPLAAPSPNK